MALEPGTRLGHYEILSALGKGGMGEVWKARDTKLSREVAIKTLPEEFARDSERLARFEREAKLLASVNHPNIAAIYGLEEHEGARFLVLELVEGDTLADRLRRGAIPLEESLKLALQIAEALEAAHEKGVVHRDLKPANIKVTPDGRVKVLDFGLAKAFGGDESDVNLSNSPTVSLTATRQGVILGTAAYMSPEQARGETADQRSDIWAFGVVLFEMLTGRATFDGKTVSDVLASVLKSEADWASLPRDLHPRIRFLLERCLEKESRSRCPAIAEVSADLRKAIAEPAATLAASAPVARRGLMAGCALAGAVVGLLLGMAIWNAEPEGFPFVGRFDYLAEGQEFRNTDLPFLAIAHDGSRFVYNTTEGLYLRDMNGSGRLIPGTEEDLFNPIFSPDDESIAFFAGGEIRTIAVTGGPATPLGYAAPPFGASWEEDGTILFGQPEGIMSVPADGRAAPHLLIPIEENEQAFGPQRLPDGRHVLFALRQLGQDWNDAQIVVQEPGGERRPIVSGRDPRYLPIGYLVYADEDALYAVPFDGETLDRTGGSVGIVEGVQRVASLLGARGTANYAFSDNGTLLYSVGTGAVAPGFTGFTGRSLVLIDRDGDNRRLLTEGAPRYGVPRFSPDGTQVAVEVWDETDTPYIWIFDVETGRGSQFTYEGNDRFPNWTSDGRIVFTSNRGGSYALYSKPLDGSSEATRIYENNSSWPTDIALDNTLAFYEAAGASGGRDLWSLDLETLSPSEFLVRAANDRGARFSPDGRLIAYVSDDLGQDEVFIRPFPASDGGQRRISDNGGVSPVFSPDGGELYYRTLLGTIVAVPFGNGQPGRHETLFDASVRFSANTSNANYDVHPIDGRFLMIETPEALTTSRQQFKVVINVFEELKERVAVR